MAVEPVVSALNLPPMEVSIEVGRYSGEPIPFVLAMQPARDPVQLAEAVLQSKIYPHLYAQLLADRGVLVAPIRVEKLEWRNAIPISSQVPG